MFLLVTVTLDHDFLEGFTYKYCLTISILVNEETEEEG